MSKRANELGQEGFDVAAWVKVHVEAWRERHDIIKDKADDYMMDLIDVAFGFFLGRGETPEDALDLARECKDRGLTGKE